MELELYGNLDTCAVVFFGYYLLFYVGTVFRGKKKGICCFMTVQFFA